MSLYTLSICKNDISESFYIIYKNEIEHTFYAKKNEDVFIDNIKYIIKSKDGNGKDLTQIIKKKTLYL